MRIPEGGPSVITSGADASLPPRATVGHRDQRVLAVIAVGYGTFAISIWSVATVYATRVSDWVLAAFLLYMLVLSAPLFIGRLAPGRSAISPPVVVSVLAVVGILRGWESLVSGLRHHRALQLPPSELDKLVALDFAYSAMGFAAYLLAFILCSRRWRNRFVERDRDQPARRSFAFDPGRKLARRAMVTILVVSVLAVAYVIYTDGSIASRLARLGGEGGRRVNLQGQYYVISAFNLGLAAAWLWLAGQPSAARRPVYWGFLCLAAASSYVVSGSRGVLVFVLLVTLLILLIRTGRVPYVGMALGALVVLYSLGLLGGAERSDRFSLVEARGGSSVVDVVESFVEGELAERATSSSGALPIYHGVPRRVGYLYGSSYVSLLLAPIPQQLWPDKPGLIDGRVGTTFYSSRTGIPPGSVAEAYWNFGPTGILVVHGLFGLAHAFVFAWFWRYRKSPWALVTYAVVVVYASTPATGALVDALVQVSVVAVGAAVLGLKPVRRFRNRRRRTLPGTRISSALERERALAHVGSPTAPGRSDAFNPDDR